MRYSAALFLVFGLVAAQIGCANVEPAADPVDDRFSDFGIVQLGDGGARDASTLTDGAVGMDLSAPVDAGATDQASPPAVDLSTTPAADLASVADLLAPPDLDTPPTCTLRLNEVLTSTTASGYYEFVEVYNPCHETLTGFTIVYRSANNTSSITAANDTTKLYTFPSTPPSSAGAYLVYGGRSFPTAQELAPLDVDGIADDGAVGLRNPSGTLVDSVAFGTVSSSNLFIRTKAAAGSTKGQSVSRVHDGADSGNNSADFHLASPTPQTSND